MVNDLRGDLYAHLQRLSLAYHGRQRVGDLLYRITADSFAVQTMIMNGVLPILSALILLGGMLIVLFPMDPLLTVLLSETVSLPRSVLNMGQGLVARCWGMMAFTVAGDAMVWANWHGIIPPVIQPVEWGGVSISASRRDLASQKRTERM